MFLVSECISKLIAETLIPTLIKHDYRKCYKYNCFRILLPQESNSFRKRRRRKKCESQLMWLSTTGCDTKRTDQSQRPTPGLYKRFGSLFDLWTEGALQGSSGRGSSCGLPLPCWQSWCPIGRYCFIIDLIEFINSIGYETFLTYSQHYLIFIYTYIIRMRLAYIRNSISLVACNIGNTMNSFVQTVKWMDFSYFLVVICSHYSCNSCL